MQILTNTKYMLKNYLKWEYKCFVIKIITDWILLAHPVYTPRDSEYIGAIYRHPVASCGARYARECTDVLFTHTYTHVHTYTLLNNVYSFTNPVIRNIACDTAKWRSIQNYKISYEQSKPLKISHGWRAQFYTFGNITTRNIYIEIDVLCVSCYIRKNWI